MKRTIALFLLTVMTCMCFSACVELVPDDPLAGLDTAAPKTEAPMETPTNTPADTAAPASDVPTAAPTDAPLDTEVPASDPATEAPTDAPSGEPTPVAIPGVTPSPTAAPTAVPTATPIPGPTPAPTDTPAPTVPPTPSPSPDPNARISFSASASLPLPSLNEDVPYGQPFCFGGTVNSTSAITSVTAVITAANGSNYTKSVTFAASDGVTSVELVDRTFPASGNNSLTYKVKFEELPVGNYVFSLYASSVSAENVLLASSSFRIVNETWRQLISNNLRNNYAYALSFFGSRDEFMFRYKWADGRNITTESGWIQNHMVTVTNPSGGSWYVHRRAKAQYEQAIYYLKNTYVRVTGNCESGVIRLSDLIRSFDGTLNTRFVSDRTFVSHHSFGTAIDLNASMDANVNTMSNRYLIRDEVRDRLAYNGIKQANGVSYYEFTYSGSHSSTYKGVPTTIINYLLYELAFFRAGFNWGYYYVHTCDAMHFGLSEMSADIHNTSSRSLRKVYSYIG